MVSNWLGDHAGQPPEKLETATTSPPARGGGAKKPDCEYFHVSASGIGMAMLKLRSPVAEDVTMPPLETGCSSASTAGAAVMIEMLAAAAHATVAHLPNLYDHKTQRLAFRRVLDTQNAFSLISKISPPS
jgi:hypothetical protein